MVTGLLQMFGSRLQVDGPKLSYDKILSDLFPFKMVMICIQ